MISVPAFMRGVRCGPHRKYQDLVFWACEGLVVCQDERPGRAGKGHYQVFRPVVLQERVDALVAQQQRFRERATAPNWQKQESRKNLAQLQDIQDCITDAKRMGDPSDPAVQAFWMKHRPGSKSTVSLSSPRKAKALYDDANLPDIMGLGEDTGRYASGDMTAEAVRDALPQVYDSLTIHKRPRRKQSSLIVL